MVELYIIRHGETVANIKNEVCGRREVELTDFGITQAVTAGNKLTTIGINKIISSPLKRARVTASIISSINNIEVMIDDRLTEFDFGCYDGHIIDEEFLNKRNNLSYRFENGESVLDAAARVYSLLSEVSNQKNDKILLVTHNAISRIINSYYVNLNDRSFFEYNLQNCEVKRLL